MILDCKSTFDNKRHNETKSLKSLLVRPIVSHERNDWDSLMAHYHYLGLRGIVGEAMRYVAILDGRWVAIIGWGAAAFKSRHRDEWIGWKPQLQWQRLKFISNNVRFLILPDVHIPNLASKILSLNLKRLSRDWEETYGHPIVLAETFVDTTRFTGTCYRASEWIPLGQTRGFRRSGGKYYAHGNPKTIYIRPLRRDVRRLLSEPLSNTKLFKEEGIVNINTVCIDKEGGLIEHLKSIPEPRKARGIRHRKISILAVAICAVLSGCRSFAAIGEWAERCSQNMLQRLWCRRDPHTKKYVPPSEPTIRRLVQQSDAKAVDKVITNWLFEQICKCGQEAIAIDGKTLKGSKGQDGKQVHLLSAFMQQQKVVIAQHDVDVKSNEITAVAPMLKDMDIQGMVVTADALHAQKETARFLVEEKHADYFFTIKDNQSTLKDDIESLHMKAFPPSA